MTPQEFISTYKWDAIWNHIRYGIPASITLAQAMIESNNGESYLAKYGNNFFGIKAYSNPDNLPVIYSSDDKPNEPFRSYGSPLDSFDDHSKFLLTNPRYLSALNTNNYVDFATQLKADGYATAPNYAQLLENNIDTYNLTKYDTYGNNKWLFLLLILILLALVVYLLISIFR